MTSRARAASAAAILAAAALALSACGSSASTATSTTRPVTTTTYKIPPQVLTPTTVIDGKEIAVPVQQPSGKPIAPYNDTGSQVIITDAGVLPFHLFVFPMMIRTLRRRAERAAARLRLSHE